MFLRVYWSRIRPGSWPDIERRYVHTADIAVPGRLARWVTQDAADPESVLTVTLWADRQSLEAWEASPAYGEGVAAVRPFVLGAQTVSLCEVKLSDLSPDLLRQGV